MNLFQQYLFNNVRLLLNRNGSESNLDAKMVLSCEHVLLFFSVWFKFDSLFFVSSSMCKRLFFRYVSQDGKCKKFYSTGRSENYVYYFQNIILEVFKLYVKYGYFRIEISLKKKQFQSNWNVKTIVKKNIKTVTPHLKYILTTQHRPLLKYIGGNQSLGSDNLFLRFSKKGNGRPERNERRPLATTRKQEKIGGKSISNEKKYLKRKEKKQIPVRKRRSGFRRTSIKDESFVFFYPSFETIRSENFTRKYEWVFRLRGLFRPL